MFPQWQALQMVCVRLYSGQRVSLFVVVALLRFTIYREQGEWGGSRMEAGGRESNERSIERGEVR